MIRILQARVTGFIETRSGRLRDIQNIVND